LQINITNILNTHFAVDCRRRPETDKEGHRRESIQERSYYTVPVEVKGKLKNSWRNVTEDKY
jgi:hypothetical protein